MGVATTRQEDRLMAATGQAGHVMPEFEAHDGIANGGVLFLIPALLSMGLLKGKEWYLIPKNHYYGLEMILITLSFMALLRIKNPEQLKQCKPGEIGRIMGIDRIPEVRCLREKIKLLSSQHHAQELNNKLIDHWYGNRPEDEELFLYIDGHVRIYYGAKANLPAKFVSRQKLCLNATTEYWVNDVQGLPVMMVMGELTEKLQTAIETQIIPQLKKTCLLAAANGAVPAQNQTPDKEQGDKKQTKTICTMVFDREAYDLPFFTRLQKDHSIAILTYRKNIKDKWEEESFKSVDVTVSGQ